MKTLVVGAVAVLIAGVAGPSALAAQSGGDGFLFGSPRIVVGFHGGLARADAGSDLFDFTTDQLTLGRRDFDGFAGGSSIYLPLTARFGLELRGTYSARISKSEFRDWVDNNDLPIEQETEFVRVPVIAGGRLYLLPQGRTIGSFAWIPSSFAPYIGAGGGFVWYRFRQSGDFVDFVDLGVFSAELVSEGFAPAAQASAGAEFALTPRLSLTAEASYLWSDASLSRDFQEFERIDLSGPSATLGISLRL